ncbi:MAG: EAL domain-containing protein [Sulfurospirillaceae bacterium]|nr:EAL domain-containing protein [Sulfurospirillaceae bacterium]MDD2826447.1 EAL domain-containing protein [Sulfurospirillaceae bacterium]
MITYIGRQPIFNIHEQCFAYELLYRSCDINNAATFENSALATARVIINLVHNLGVNVILGEKIGFVNVDEAILFSDTLLLLPKDKFRFEILEYTRVTLALIERIKYMYSLGYRFSLDDFDCSDATMRDFEPLFPYIDIIKIDILALGIKNVSHAIAKLKRHSIDLLAEKIETYEEYITCQKLHFKFFQGYFFEKPMIVSGEKFEPNVMNALRLMNCIYENDDPNFISQKLSTCPDLVYNLLRHLNSGAYHFRTEITNIKQMITLLGSLKLLSWLGLFLYESPEKKPFGEELFNSAKFRAKLMEELALLCGYNELANKAFLTGSLSLLDAYLSMPMEEFLLNLNLDQEMKDALLFHKGILGEFLHIAIEMNHSKDIEAMIQGLTHAPCFKQEDLLLACSKASIFVTESNHTKE